LCKLIAHSLGRGAEINSTSQFVAAKVEMSSYNIYISHAYTIVAQ